MMASLSSPFSLPTAQATTLEEQEQTSSQTSDGAVNVDLKRIGGTQSE